MPVDRSLPCIVCNKRRRHFVNNTCKKCGDLIAAEGTHELFGLSTKTPTQLRWEARCAEYNSLIRQGFTQQEAAVKLNMKLSALRNQVLRWKRIGGLKVVPGYGPNQKARAAGKPLKATSKIAPASNEHGGGKWGKKKCPCEPCMQVRRESRKEMNREWRARMKKRKEEQAANKPS